MESKKRIVVPREAALIMRRLEEHGHEAYAVGGCVRDSLLGRKPQDWDITTSARPDEVKAIFPRTVDTGIRHGTVTVLAYGGAFEVTTYRVDGEYEDARHPKEVRFTSSLAEDLRRRDFTINAMAYNERDGLVDEFGGMGDLSRGVIRCVGDAGERFSEDALRMLRAVRFAAQLGFEIEGGTLSAMSELSGSLKMVSAERIQAELVKLLTSDHPGELEVAWRAGLTAVFLPEFDRMMETPQNNPHHCHSVGGHTLRALEESPPDRVIRLALLLHDVAKPDCRTTDEGGIDHFYGHPERGSEMAAGILRRLKFDNDTVARVKALVRWHDDNPPLSPAAIRRAASRIGASCYPGLFAVKRADIMAQSPYRREEKLSYVSRYEEMYGEIKERGSCLSIGQLAVTGSDLIGAGMAPGREIGAMLRHLLDVVLDDPAKNEREILLEEAAREIGRG